ncbi:MAG: EthD family reductase [Chloroflexi bacterium]|nr:EthD family reductase [Chloroflexota bacterium]
MPVTLLALYRRPDGGVEALETFQRRYAEEHAPLMRQVPGLRSMEVSRVQQALTESDIVMTCAMAFDGRAELDAALASDEMRAAGRNIRAIAPGLLTLLVVEREP